MNDDVLEEDGPLQHEPIHPPREDVVGEMVFTRRWRELMARSPRYGSSDSEEPMLESVLRYLGEPDQRDATVAASFVGWLGSPIGGGVIDHARRLPPGSPGFSPGPHAVSWLHENRRMPHVNCGYRSIELILSPVDVPRGRLGLPAYAPEIRPRDLEVVEAVAAWLDTEEGGTFLGECLAEIGAYHLEQQRRRRADRVIGVAATT